MRQYLEIGDIVRCLHLRAKRYSHVGAKKYSQEELL
jgi:hypothetical protein